MECSEDRFLGGRIVARQPREGFRSGIDAVMLAAAVPAGGGEDILELGCGVGVASLCLSSRVPNCEVTGVEIAPELTAIANENARANSLEKSVRFEQGDAFRLPKHLRGTFNHVFCNPPFHEGAGEKSPNADRARARSDFVGLGNWIRVGLSRVAAGGTVTAILRADRLGDILKTVPQNGVCVFPLWPRTGEAAKRIVLQIRKNSRAPLRLAAGLVLHDDQGAYTPLADAILRNAASLALTTPRM